MAWPRGVPRGPRKKKEEEVLEASPSTEYVGTTEAPVDARLAPKPKKKGWAMRAGNNWESATETEANPDEYNIPRDQFPEGMDMQWWTYQIFGQDTYQRMQLASQGGWTPVHNEDFDGWHKRVLGSRYALDNSGFIVHKGVMLCARPIEYSLRSRKRDLQKARDQIALKEAAFKGGEIAATGANHPTALATNRINRSLERIEIPKE